MAEHARAPGGPSPGGVAVVTGASGAVGRACCEALEARGHTVVGTWRTNPVEDRPSVQLDVTDDEATTAVMAAIERDHGPIDVVVANAGYAHLDLAIRAGAADVRAVIDADLTGAFLTARAAATGMVRRRYGRIVLMSSVAALTGVPGYASYSAAKAGMIGLARALAREVGPRNVTVNVVAPGLLENAGPVLDEAHAAQGITAAWVAATPVGRLGRLDELAATVCYLAEPRSGFVTGAVIPVDGGFGMGFA